jgi:hypothetical protein
MGEAWVKRVKPFLLPCLLEGKTHGYRDGRCDERGPGVPRRALCTKPPVRLRLRLLLPIVPSVIGCLERQTYIGLLPRALRDRKHYFTAVAMLRMRWQMPCSGKRVALRHARGRKDVLDYPTLVFATTRGNSVPLHLYMPDRNYTKPHVCRWCLKAFAKFRDPPGSWISRSNERLVCLSCLWKTR